MNVTRNCGFVSIILIRSIYLLKLPQAKIRSIILIIFVINMEGATFLLLNEKTSRIC